MQVLQACTRNVEGAVHLYYALCRPQLTHFSSARVAKQQLEALNATSPEVKSKTAALELYVLVRASTLVCVRK
jgi:hypothetical protein